jgi:threonine/homoserine/homoserine lactone efflux protein
MLTFDTVLSFFAINLSLSLIPCAEMMIVITQSSQRGSAAGIAFVAGICIALVGQVILMAFGVSVIIQTSVVVFTALKVIGVCFLFFLSWQTFNQPIMIETQKVAEPAHLLSLFRKGIVINVSSPMPPLYLLLLFPPFIHAGQGSYSFQAMQLGALMIIAFIIVYTGISITADKVAGEFLQSEKVQYFLRLGAGSTIACFAIYLALAKQSF